MVCGALRVRLFIRIGFASAVALFAAAPASRISGSAAAGTPVSGLLALEEVEFSLEEELLSETELLLSGSEDSEEELEAFSSAIFASAAVRRA